MTETEILLTEAERQPCEVWTRVMGYHRPVSEFNPGKQSEHAERRHFLEARAEATLPREEAARCRSCA
ncbi:MAG: hypothetical protein B7Z66_14330 [Chromatiales bacterium 21-64-14]|nr:MAG: hypothetical protein B7Z66_14330 [Chromatiales bacterium 21-64-14]